VQYVGRRQGSHLAYLPPQKCRATSFARAGNHLPKDWQHTPMESCRGAIGGELPASQRPARSLTMSPTEAQFGRLRRVMGRTVDCAATNRKAPLTRLMPIRTPAPLF